MSLARSSSGCCGGRCLLARDGAHRTLGLWLAGLLGFQFLLGGLDVLLRAPVWMQVVHLAGADAFWCVLVVLTAAVTTIAAKQPDPSLR